MEMVRYARSGGEILSIAIRIARAYTGRDKAVICGYFQQIIYFCKFKKPE